jgi:putative ATPase
MADSIPLAERLRPIDLETFIGQKHLVGKNKPIYQVIQSQQVPSMILWGPPGVGKTTLARIIANHTHMDFVALSAVSAGKADLQKIIARPQTKQPTLFDDDEPSKQGTLLFLDEIHRFNKAQQDFLLPYVENGTLTLIGATTENPSFEVNSALLSRMQVFVLQSLTEDDLLEIVQRGAEILGVSLVEDASLFLAQYADGDARTALNLLDNTVRLYGQSEEITLEQLRETLQSRRLRYDKTGEDHYNTISAFIKSMRASNVDAALYYLARMIDAGEDPKFIARRMVIFASEDIGMALPTALVVANEVFRAVETVGLPEAQINLAHGVTYLASAPKDRSSYDAYFRALEDVQKRGSLPIPLVLRNPVTNLMRDAGYGEGYALYTTDDLLPEALKGKRYYTPPKRD